MKCRTLFGALLLFGAAHSVYAAQGLLPSSFGGWTASGAETQVSAHSLDQVAKGKEGILREYGVASAESADYSQNGQTATAVLYRMVDPSAAFGAFTFLRDAGMVPLAADDSVAYSAASPGRALLVVGNFLLDVSAPQTRPQDRDLIGFAAGLFPRADHRPYPPIIGFLPKDGLIHGSEVYLLGPQVLARAFPMNKTVAPDWIGFDKSAEAIVAHYHLDGQPKDKEAILLLAIYPTQQIAADAYGQLDKSISLNPAGDQVRAETAVFGARSSALVALISGVESRDSASGFLQQIHYTSDVTWNEPTHELTDPSISTIVVGAILDTGSIMMLAVAAGIGFGGLRLLMKFVMPGRVFDRDEEVEILQLGLTSKPVNSKDFY
jgi:hypothetical protein